MPFLWGQVRVELFFCYSLVVVSAMRIAMAFFLSVALVLAAVFATAVLVAAVFVLLVILILFHVFFSYIKRV